MFYVNPESKILLLGILHPDSVLHVTRIDSRIDVNGNKRCKYRISTVICQDGIWQVEDITAKIANIIPVSSVGLHKPSAIIAGIWSDGDVIGLVRQIGAELFGRQGNHLTFVLV